jgi:hypothetical protein
VDVTATLRADVAEGVLFAVIEDLTTYPSWLEIVDRVEPADAAPGDGGPAYLVDLRGQLGPLRRSKRLRMVRTLDDRPHRVRFERTEVDGRSHSPWVMDGVLTPAGPDPVTGEEGLELEIRLHYGGSLWMPLMDRVLADEIERSRPRLLRLVGSSP